MGQPEAEGESCSMDTIFHASLVWIMGWSTHCWNVSSPGQQTEPEPSPAVQDWPQCSAAEVHNTVLAASSLSQGAILLGSSQWTAQSSLKKKFCISCLAWNDLYVELTYPSVDIWPGRLDLAQLCVSLAPERYFQSQWLIVSEMQGKVISSKWHLSHAPSHDL